MSSFRYYTKQGIFETNNYFEIPWSKLHSSDENTPAYETSNAKSWYFEGKLHRLSGPADIGKYIDFEFADFYIYGKSYKFKDWILNHPNIDIYLDEIGVTDITEKAIWKLKNI